MIRFCTRCVISNQRPRISFDAEGVCSACRHAENKQRVNWSERERELRDTLERFRRKDGRHDVIVPCSGGKDGSFVAHQLKHKYGMNPLTVTWAPNAETEIGRQNLQAFIDSGFDNVYFRPNGQVNRKLCRLAFEHMGDPFQAFIYGQTNFPLRISQAYNIPLIMYGENGEVEYGGDMKNAERPTRDISDHDGHYFSGKPVEFWHQFGLTDQDLEAYKPPQEIKGTEIHFLGYYTKWDPQENFYYCQANTGFKPNPKRSEGTYSKYASLDDKLDPFHYYLGYLKFGIGRATSDAAHEIRDGKITREEGVALVKRYDSEKPSENLIFFLNYCGLTEPEYLSICNRWRGGSIWNRNGDEYQLRSAVYL